MALKTLLARRLRRRVIEGGSHRQLPVRFALVTPIAFVIHPELRHAPSTRPADLMLDEACLLANAIGLRWFIVR